MKVIKKRQTGFSAVIAIVLIVVFALLGSYMLTLTNVSAVNTAQSGQSMQAWFAARTGLEWAVYDAVQNGAAGLNCNGAGPSFPLSGGSTGGFTIQLSCISTAVSEGGSAYNVFNLTSTASKNAIGTVTYTSRTITASITDAP